jgi:hypothetical protein
MISTLIGILSLLVISVGVGVIVYFIMEAKNRKVKNNYVGGCSTTRWGCCKDNITPKYDQSGTNCVEDNTHTHSNMKFPQYNDKCGDSMLCNNIKVNNNVIEPES